MCRTFWELLTSSAIELIKSAEGSHCEVACYDAGRQKHYHDFFGNG